ncbi:hypothetical protein BDW22DRAFT_1343088 [Trametopsis cervina]|nr:hypothetical protein BDW22DRAFT_1343088 [Trametopsis cervina]
MACGMITQVSDLHAAEQRPHLRMRLPYTLKKIEHASRRGTDWPTRAARLTIAVLWLWDRIHVTTLASCEMKETPKHDNEDLPAWAYEPPWTPLKGGTDVFMHGTTTSDPYGTEMWCGQSSKEEIYLTKRPFLQPARRWQMEHAHHAHRLYRWQCAPMRIQTSIAPGHSTSLELMMSVGCGAKRGASRNPIFNGRTFVDADPQPAPQAHTLPRHCQTATPVLPKPYRASCRSMLHLEGFLRNSPLSGPARLSARSPWFARKSSATIHGQWMAIRPRHDHPPA